MLTCIRLERIWTYPPNMISYDLQSEHWCVKLWFRSCSCWHVHWFLQNVFGKTRWRFWWQRGRWWFGRTWMSATLSKYCWCESLWILVGWYEVLGSYRCSCCSREWRPACSVLEIRMIVTFCHFANDIIILFYEKFSVIILYAKWEFREIVKYNKVQVNS